MNEVMRACFAELKMGDYQLTGVKAFVAFCKFSEWCLNKCLEVTKGEKLRNEILAVSQMCASCDIVRESWLNHKDAITAIAMGDSGGPEGRAADVVFCIVNVCGTHETRYASMTIRKMLRLATADEIHAALVKATS